VRKDAELLVSVLTSDLDRAEAPTETEAATLPPSRSHAGSIGFGAAAAAVVLFFIGLLGVGATFWEDNIWADLSAAAVLFSFACAAVSLVATGVYLFQRTCR
jgi:hypothetical protein